MNDNCEYIFIGYIFIGAILFVAVCFSIMKDVALGKALVPVEERSPLLDKMMWAIRIPLVFILVVLAWPAVIAYALFGYVRDKIRWAQEVDDCLDGQLKFTSMGGEGWLRCNSCLHEEEITCFMHSGNESCRMGMQCPDCANIKGIPGNPWPKTTACECGGTYERDNVVVCPSCKSGDIDYRPIRIT
ncbi:MAG: hypothetical protein V7744_08890 [Pseudomonadales bacterium]